MTCLVSSYYLVFLLSPCIMEVVTQGLTHLHTTTTYAAPATTAPATTAPATLTAAEPGVHDSGIMYACANSPVDIPWSYTLNNGERIEDIQWHYEQGTHRAFIAVFADNSFVAMPGFEGKVSQFDNAGLRLNSVRVVDTGNYTATVGIHGSGDTFRQEKFHVTLQVGDSLMTEDGYLHIVLEPEAVRNPRTGSWAIQLKCGVFTYFGDPPILMEWLKPTAESVSSYEYLPDSKQFYLLVDDPVEGGNYTCRIPQTQLEAACLTRNHAALAQATKYVDKIAARLAILEGENKELKKQVQCANVTCPHELHNIMSNLI